MDSLKMSLIFVLVASIPIIWWGRKIIKRDFENY